MFQGICILFYDNPTQNPHEILRIHQVLISGRRLECKYGILYVSVHVHIIIIYVQSIEYMDIE